jgi:hypothetical protein
MEDQKGEYFGQYAAIPLIEDKNNKFIATNETRTIELFDNFHEAEQYITQLCKPFYYEQFGSNYEIKYVDEHSEEWKNIFNNWVSYYEREKEELETLIEKVSSILLWYERIWIKIISFM